MKIIIPKDDIVKKENEKKREEDFPQGSNGQCRCPNCGHRESSQLTVPCYNRICPKCGTPMTQA